MKSKDIAIVGILLAVGAILRYFLAMLHTPLTPNMIIAFYCLAIILIQPKVYEALGIGIVAGVLSMLISSSMFPPANLISEPLGALACFGLYALLKSRTRFAPTATTFIATLVSGFSFAAIAILRYRRDHPCKVQRQPRELRDRFCADRGHNGRV